MKRNLFPLLICNLFNISIAMNSFPSFKKKNHPATIEWSNQSVTIESNNRRNNLIENFEQQLYKINKEDPASIKLIEKLNTMEKQDPQLNKMTCTSAEKHLIIGRLIKEKILEKTKIINLSENNIKNKDIEQLMNAIHENQCHNDTIKLLELKNNIIHYETNSQYIPWKIQNNCSMIQEIAAAIEKLEADINKREDDIKNITGTCKEFEYAIKKLEEEGSLLEFKRESMFQKFKDQHKRLQSEISNTLKSFKINNNFDLAKYKNELENNSSMLAQLEQYQDKIADNWSRREQLKKNKDQLGEYFSIHKQHKNVIEQLENDNKLLKLKLEKNLIELQKAQQEYQQHPDHPLIDQLVDKLARESNNIIEINKAIDI